MDTVGRTDGTNAQMSETAGVHASVHARAGAQGAMKERIGAKIKDLRTEKLMTQSELAGDRITRSMLSLIEHGNTEPSLSSLAYLADRLHVSPAFLLADEGEDELYRRAARIRDVRIAYASGEYRICLDLCRAIGLPEDDELTLLTAECLVALAIEELSAGNLRAVGDYLSEAVEAADATRYRSAHIYAEASVLSRYLGRYSESLYTGAEDAAPDRGVPLSVAAGEPFCAYALAVAELDGGAGREEVAEALSMLRLSAPLPAMHAEVLLLVREGRMSDALALIETMLGGGDPIPMPILYELFRDREVCARETGDYKGAYESAGAKHELLSRMLTEA